ncbi:hypothetical protein CLUG_02285 [Clavispora lusitaniae ATCC 42720]|uniref:Uncharacterized protein n=1 Tax=Clavispora lusitaniae (strain ATCC 42720) TaxID=306902 RepID=C4Y253_CLAL4|nr:uncharacterized protein CLUG_02285 [Clavispora lusitaniae ATCC 42720]EEQ38162.1 hypothetical protein CLUG_02285 [Clavispora lusitaniae ATCC 42720]
MISSPKNAGDITVMSGKCVPPADGVVGNNHISGLEFALPEIRLETNACRHGSEMHRNMGGVCHKISLGIEQSARKVQSFLDIDRHRRFLQGSTHSLGNVHEPVAEDGKQHGINRLCWDILSVRKALLLGRIYGDHHVTLQDKSVCGRRNQVCSSSVSNNSRSMH